VADNKKDVDVLSGVETTGHEWDGIKELDNPMPRWWLWTFYATIIWSIGYWVLMPAWPLISDYTRGFLGYSQRQVVTKDLQKAAADRAAQAGGLVTASLEEINNTPEMFAFAMAAGQAAFGDNCAPCHGSGGQGAKGYPNLADDDWLWGGTLADIHQTVQYGIRDPHPDTRISQMPAFLKDEMLTRTEVDNVVEYVLALSGQDHDKARAAAGAAVFADNCAVCHGNEGKGDRVQGAPDLTDAIWLYGGDRAAIRETVANSRYGIMPAWVGRLDPVTIKSLAVYVHALGGGE
jgi:cytochrome c oxidase cbb3-type subunit 3